MTLTYSTSATVYADYIGDMVVPFIYDPNTALPMNTSFATTYPKPQTFVSARAKTRAGELESELATTRQLDTVILQILLARRYCPRVFEEFKREILAAINDDLNELVAKIQPEPEPSATIDEDATGDATGIEQLIAFFRARNNTPATIDEMAKAIDKTKVTVKMIVYKRHKEKFERMPERGKNNAAYFRLADK